MKPKIVYLRDDQIADLAEIRRQRGRVGSEVVRAALDEYLGKYRRRKSEIKVKDEGK